MGKDKKYEESAVTKLAVTKLMDIGLSYHEAESALRLLRGKWNLGDAKMLERLERITLDGVLAKILENAKPVLVREKED